MKSLDIPEMQLRVLAYLAQHGPKTEYELSKDAELKSYTAHMAPKALMAKGMLKAVPEGRARTGRTIVKYHLTLKGLATVVAAKKVQGKMDKVAERWKHLLPLVLGKWTYFRKVGLENEILMFFEREKEAWDRVMEITGEEGQTWLDDVAERFSMARFRNFMFSLQPWESRLKWYKAVRGNQELKEWAVRELKGEIARAEAWAECLKETLTLTLARSEPDWDKVKWKKAVWPGAILAP